MRLRLWPAAKSCQYSGASAVRLVTSRRYSSSTTLIKRTFEPAPHYGSICVLAFDEPTTRNALSRALVSELGSHIKGFAEEWASGPGRATTRAVILASDLDDAFCSGADLQERISSTAEATRADLDALRQTFDALEALPIPTIAAVHGAAFGSGLELALAAHLRIVSAEARLALPDARLGLVPGLAGGARRAAALVGPGLARDMLLTGRAFTGLTAWERRLAERVVQPGTAEGEERARVREGALAWAREICEGAPRALRGVLRATGGGAAAEREQPEQVLESRDLAEGLRSVVERRKPKFTGE